MVTKILITLFIILFQILHPMEWKTDQVSNIIQLVAAIATVLALWYAFYRDRKQDKKINDLANIVGQLNEANKLQQEQNIIQQKQHDIESRDKQNKARPIMTLKSVSLGTDLILTIEIENIGERAIIEGSLFPDTNDLDFSFSATVIDKNESFILYGRTKSSKEFSESTYIIRMTITDIYGNPYWLRLTGKGKTVYDFTVIDPDHTSAYPT